MPQHHRNMRVEVVLGDHCISAPLHSCGSLPGLNVSAQSVHRSRSPQMRVVLYAKRNQDAAGDSPSHVITGPSARRALHCTPQAAEATAGAGAEAEAGAKEAAGAEAGAEAHRKAQVRAGRAGTDAEEEVSVETMDVEQNTPCTDEVTVGTATVSLSGLCRNAAVERCIVLGPPDKGQAEHPAAGPEAGSGPVRLRLLLRPTDWGLLPHVTVAVLELLGMPPWVMHAEGAIAKARLRSQVLPPPLPSCLSQQAPL